MLLHGTAGGPRSVSERSHLTTGEATEPDFDSGDPECKEDVAQTSGAGNDDRPLTATVDDWLVGTPDEVIDQLRAYIGLGISHFMLWFLDFPSLGGLRLFSERVLPFIHLFGLGDEVQNTKALYKHLGIFRSDEVRLPLIPCSRERLREVVMAYDLCQSAAVQQHA